MEVLTLGAVTVTARVEGETLVSTTVPARLKMSAEDFGTAVGYIPDDLALFGAGWMGLYEGLSVTTEDLGQLYGVHMPGRQRGSVGYFSSSHGCPPSSSSSPFGRASKGLSMCEM